MTTIAGFSSPSLGLALALAAASPAIAALSPAQAASAPQTVPYPATDPSFSRPDAQRMPSRATLRAFLTETKRYARANTFCFVQRRLDRPETADPGMSVLSMIWHEGKAIYLVNLVRSGERYERDSAMDPLTEGRLLASSTDAVDLTTDVVPTDEDVGTSTFLVSRSWVDRELSQCRRVGVQVRIAAFKPPTTTP
ncbi:hypothetical protein VDF98_03650 [Xanthomonas campestris pv. raphani]|uniref:hypothetical protein n=1 Tax=Xanthomonas campestris TaxID=339 RepID=UPI0023681AA4|nr:hypothetical protein [Xanthomonas campestris]MEA9822369.1 hypothetical protein [Xanthomonas campestris pv. raphani]MEA9850898.1 hypothetical protein [Xanthomonas campestris pv. raphani]MEA9855071.1 hypothetical protein [Xanthomonas campestris pv. raphani]MEA9963812.1 hypothetical protein [Xanthomonas campestris pv. raphani]WDJ20458.1 hypothetical protein JH270_10890 [Xanthomonas campestris pv. raphani]